jgi:hypothetical protein
MAMMANSFRHAARIVVRDEHAVVAFELLIADRRLYAEHVIRIALGGIQMAGLDRVELADGEAEARGDLLKELFLLLMHFLICFRYVEETVKDVLKQFAVAVEYSHELFGTGLKVGCLPLAELKIGAACFISAADILNASLKALTSSASTVPSALAILALSTMTPTVNVTSLSGSESTLRA